MKFCQISLDTSNKHAPCKKKDDSGNQIPFFDFAPFYTMSFKNHNVLRFVDIINVECFVNN